MKKKVILAPDQHNPPDLCFRTSTLRKPYFLIHVEIAHRGPTVIPHWQGTFRTSFYRSPPMIRLDDSNTFNPSLLSRYSIAPNNIRGRSTPHDFRAISQNVPETLEYGMLCYCM